MADYQKRAAPVRAIRRDLIVALLLAAILSISWALSDWPRLSRLLLPDTDDMVRLVQVRDWLNGQGVNDWTQYRMAPPAGTPMHWSRVNDVGPALLILLLTPLLGAHGADLSAILLYPGLLFVCSTFLTARIARALWGGDAALVAAILAVLAFPGTTLFTPGRIDHHALQIVLAELTVLMLLGRATMWRGAVAGAAVALSLVIGLESVIQSAALLGVAAIFWIVDGRAERARLGALGASLGAITLCFLLFLRPSYWNAALCDAFTPASAAVAIGGGGAFATLALATPWLPHWRARMTLGGLLGVAVLGGTLWAFPACISGPYGQMDPFLQRELMPHISEARSLLALAVPEAISAAGLLIVACVAATGMTVRAPAHWTRFLPLLAVLLSSGLIMLAQVRGANIGVPLSVPVMAGLVLAARRRTRFRMPVVLAAWAVSAGILYHEAPHALLRVAGVQQPVPTGEGKADCIAGDAWQQMDRYPQGVVMASTTIAPYVLGATHHATVGAGYHRNDTGNMAMYRFFIGDVAERERIARSWRVRYVLFCPNEFSELHPERRFPGSLATQLRAGKVPAGLERLPLTGTALRLYRVSALH